MMKIVKIAVSPAIRESIPTWPREGSAQGVSVTGMVTGSALMNHPQKFPFLLEIRNAANLTALLVLPIRVFRMLDIPKRPAALDFGNDRKVISRRWRRCRPFQRPRVPRIVSSRTSLNVRPDQVE